LESRAIVADPDINLSIHPAREGIWIGDWFDAHALSF